MVRAASLLAIFASTLATANSLEDRKVTELDSGFEKAQQKDLTATRALTNVQIKTEDGKCLFVDKLGGDKRANLAPVQVADCGSTDGQGFDVITEGKHIKKTAGRALIVSTLTNACMTFDPRRPAASQVHFFSCGGRADGEGEVSDSQLIGFDAGKTSNVKLQTQNTKLCFTAGGDTLTAGDCNGSKTSFTLGDNAGGGGDNGNKGNKDNKDNNNGKKPSASVCSGQLTTVTNVVTVTVTGSPPPSGMTAQADPSKAPLTTVTYIDKGSSSSTSSTAKTTSTPSKNDKNTSTSSKNDKSTSTSSKNDKSTSTTTSKEASSTNGVVKIPVARGGFLDSDGSERAHQFDKTANRAIQSVHIQTDDGRCIKFDTLSGDSLQNLLPLTFAECEQNADSQLFDMSFSSKNNDGRDGEALIIGSHFPSCLSYDRTRPQNDRVNMFSCGGKAQGSGEFYFTNATNGCMLTCFLDSNTDKGQLFPVSKDFSKNTFKLQPLSDKDVCITSKGVDRLTFARCDNSKEQTFKIISLV